MCIVYSAYVMLKYTYFICLFDSLNCFMLFYTLLILYYILYLMVYLYFLCIFVIYFFRAVKQLIAINRIQNKSLCLHNICGCTVYNYFVYKYTHMYVYLGKKYYLYLKYLYII